jgi:predicted transcriptional regulator YdeE
MLRFNRARKENEAVNNKMMHYAGVMTEESAPEEVRVIQFPKGEYLFLKGKGGRLTN